MLIAYLKLMRLHKPIGMLLLLWPVLSCLYINSLGLPSSFTLVIFLVGVILVRSAGCIINDVADKDFDLYVERTKNRPIATGYIKRANGVMLFLFLIITSWLLVKSLDVFTSQLSIGAVLLAMLYPLTKRFIYVPQLILGIAFSFGVVMASAAITNRITVSTWVLFCANTIWSVAYDTQYAMMDEMFDRKIGVKSTAVLLGRKSRAFISFLQIVVIILLVELGIIEKMNYLYFLCVTLSTLIFIFQNSIIKSRERKSFYYAFLSNNLFGLVFFTGTVLGIN